MELTVRKAVPCENTAVRDFYYRVMDDMQALPYHPKWTKGVYPDDAYLESAVDGGEMYLAESEGEIVGAMILNGHQGVGYENAEWKVNAREDEVAVIHTLCVLPSQTRRGIGSLLTEKAAEISRLQGKKVIRLDVLVGNLPADRLYRSAGYEFVQRLKLFYEDTGWCDFDLFEYKL